MPYIYVVPELFPKPTTVDLVLLDLVANDTFGRVKKLGGADPVAPCRLKCILNEVLLVRAHGVGE